MNNKVSIVMCTYNGEKYLKDQIDSIINQTYPIHELIIQDDCSTDHTMDILLNYEKEYACVHVFRNEIQKGINENFFSAIARATGDYVAISDQDDIWEKDKIERQMETIGENWLSSCFSKPFAEGDAVVYFDRRKPNIYLERLYVACAIPGHTLLIKKDLINLIPKNADFVLYDLLLSITAAAYNKIFFLEKVLVRHRRHFSAATYGVPVNTQRNIKNLYHYFVRTLTNYIELRNEVSVYFFRMYLLLKSFPDQNSGKMNAQKMALYQSQKGIIAFVKLVILCIKFRDRIFYSEEKNKVVSILRAIYYPIACSDYYRYMSKKPKNRQ